MNSFTFLRGDVNTDGILDLADPISNLAYQFMGDEGPAAPGLTCGVDPTEDALGCENYRSCRAGE